MESVDNYFPLYYRSAHTSYNLPERKRELIGRGMPSGETPKAVIIHIRSVLSSEDTSPQLHAIFSVVQVPLAERPFVLTAAVEAFRYM